MAGQYWDAGRFGSLPSWTLVFAREPEPDMDMDVEIDESGSAPGQPSSSGAPSPQKPPRLRILTLILLLLVVAGGAYLAMDPDIVMKLIGQDQSLRTPPPMTVNRPASVPRPSPPPRAMDSESSDSAAAPAAISPPSFGEGQRVSILFNSASPGTPLSLSQDAAGTQPGPTVSAIGTLLVLDAELHNNTWIYLVRTEEGAKGWIAEKQLTAKP